MLSEYISARDALAKRKEECMSALKDYFKDKCKNRKELAQAGFRNFEKTREDL